MTLPQWDLLGASSRQPPEKGLLQHPVALPMLVVRGGACVHVCLARGDPPGRDAAAGQRDRVVHASEPQLLAMTVKFVCSLCCASQIGSALVALVLVALGVWLWRSGALAAMWRSKRVAAADVASPARVKPHPASPARHTPPSGARDHLPRNGHTRAVQVVPYTPERVAAAAAAAEALAAAAAAAAVGITPGGSTPPSGQPGSRAKLRNGWLSPNPGDWLAPRRLFAGDDCETSPEGNVRGAGIPGGGRRADGSVGGARGHRAVRRALLHVDATGSDWLQQPQQPQQPPQPHHPPPPPLLPPESQRGGGYGGGEAAADLMVAKAAGLPVSC